MSNPPTTPTNGNQAKYLSYRLAHDRMKAAIEADFPLEAVTIAESLITDRLLSFVNFHGAGFDKPEKAMLVRVAEKAVKICQKITQDPQGQALAERAQSWAQERNNVLHAIAKSAQGQGPKTPAESFLAVARDVAARGLALVKDIKSWHQKQLRQPAPQPSSS